jgi:alpha-glucosidase
MRTFPNAVTREFCFAQLDSKRVFEPKTFVTSVFVNMLAGPIDMNNGFFDLRQGKTTRVDNPMECPSTLVAEAARTLITFSGATIIPDIPEFYQKYPELLKFIADQQQPWRESKTLSGVIGEHIVMARESAKGVWLVGAATSEDARELDVKLDFLPPGNYQATIVQDGEDGHYQKNRETLRVEKRLVSPNDTLSLKLASGGGACVILEKSN